MEYLVYYKKGLSTEEVEQVKRNGWTSETVAKTSGVFRPDLDTLTVFREYAAVAKVEADTEDEVFGMMNRMATQPSQSLLKQLGVKHTSMSVGDVLVRAKGLVMLQCSEEGWEEVPL